MIAIAFLAYTAAMRVRQQNTHACQRPPVPVVALAFLVTLILLVFSSVLTSDFIRLDDYRHILENPNLARPSLSGLVGYWTKPYFGLFIPITYSTWWVGAAIAHVFGPLKQDAWLFHGLNLACHIVNASLVFFVVRQLLRLVHSDGSAELGESKVCAIALIAAAVFAVHPAQVETVAWVSELKGQLSTMFGLLGIWSYQRSSRRGPATLFFVAAMLAKPSGIVFPGILLLLNRILLGKSAKESLTMLALPCALSVPLVFITKSLQPNHNMEFIPTVGQRLIVAADAFGFYVWKLVWPFSLALDYGRSPQYVISHLQNWKLAGSSLLLAASLAAMAAGVLRPSGPGVRRPWLSLVACGASIFVLALVPVLGAVPFEFQDISTVADHYMYVSVFGVSLAAAGLMLRFWASIGALVICAALLLLSSGLSFQQATLWKSTEALFNHTLTLNQRSYLANYSIGAELSDRGRFDEAIQRFTEALAIKPDYLYAQVALGTAWIQKGQFQNAIEHYLSVLDKNPSFVGKRAALVSSMHNNLGMALHKVDRHEEGTDHFRKAVEIDPQSPNGHLNLGTAELDSGRYLDALTEYEKALALSPSNSAIERQMALARRMIRKQLR